MHVSSCCSLMISLSADTPRKGSRSCTISLNCGMTLGPPPFSPASILRMNGEKQLSDEKECYGKLDGIRRRLTTGFTVLIEKA